VRYPCPMPTRYARLPLPAFLAALDTWRARPAPEEREGLSAALAFLLERTGFAGAALDLDAPPLAPVSLAAGSLAPGAKRPAREDEVAELPLLTQATANALGEIRIDGEPLDAPTAIGLVKLDGADTVLMHRLIGDGSWQIGARVEAVMRATATGSILDIEGFSASG